MVMKTVLLCDDDDIARQEQIDAYKGDPDARDNVYTDVADLALCEDIETCQRMIWDLQQELLKAQITIAELEEEVTGIQSVFEDEFGVPFEELFEEVPDDDYDEDEEAQYYESEEEFYGDEGEYDEAAEDDMFTDESYDDIFGALADVLVSDEQSVP